MPSLQLSPKDYERIDRTVGLTGDEYYAVVSHRVRGRWLRSIHVFARPPMKKELIEYENAASRIKVRGRKTEFEGSQLTAASRLYDALISRVYDVPVGWRIYGEVTVDDQGRILKGAPLSREQAIEMVPATIKREAIRDSIGEMYSEARIADLEGEDEEFRGDDHRTEDD